MTTKRDFHRRLDKLESQVPREVTEEEVARSRIVWPLHYAVCFYLGDPTPEESVAEAHMRALGYSDSDDYNKALGANDPDFNERMTSAYKKLWAKFGVNMEDAIQERKWYVFEDALKRMEAGLSEQYKNYVRAMIEWDLMLLRNGYYDKLRKNRVL